MKFKISTMFWLMTVVAVVIACWLWVLNERSETAEKIADSEARMAELQEDVNNYVANQMGKIFYFKRQLGVIPNSENLTQSHIQLVRLPDELGGKQLFGLPFTWQWRMLLTQPNDFELCWSLHDIPTKESFDIPAASIHRSHLNIADGFAPIGGLGAEPNDALSGSQPLEVILYFRIDGDSEGGNIQINYEIAEPGELRSLGQTVYRGVTIQLSPDDIQWMRSCQTSRGGYSISGFGIEHSYDHIPLLNQSFSLDNPLTLVKIRSQKPLGPPFKFEPYPGPCPGLQIWIQKKSGPSTDLPKRIWVTPEAKNE